MDLHSDLLTYIFNLSSESCKYTCKFVCKKFNRLIKVNKVKLSKCDFTHSKEQLKWLMSLGVTMESLICSTIAFNGDLSLLQWAREKNIPWDASTCSLAILGKHMDVYNWARLNGCLIDSYSTQFAAAVGNFSLLKSLKEEGVPMNYEVCYCIARFGDIEMMKWAISNGLNPTSSDFCGAASKGHLEMIKWLRTIATWDKWSICHALSNRQMDVLEYLWSEGCPRDSECCAVAARKGDILLLKWLKNHGFVFDDFMYEAGTVKAREYILSTGYKPKNPLSL